MDKKLEDHLEEQTETIIGPSATIQGDLISDGSIKIEGRVTGNITTSQMVSISPNAKVTAKVEAESAVIGGEVHGHLNIFRRLVLLSTAKVTANITCPTLKVEEGALFTGQCAMNDSVLATAIKKDK
jgi:cytoskeletal protein CcmA (bactofilin family)